MSAGAPPRIPPSGEQFELAHGDQRAVVVEVSGGVRSYQVGDRQLLDGYGVEEMCSGGRGQLLVPWPNRLRDGRYQFDGITHQVPLSEPEKLNAIHGFLRWERWTAREHASDQVVLEHTLHPRAGYPFTLHAAVEYRLDHEGLSVSLTAENLGERRCPYGAGVHPYLRPGAGAVDDWWLEAPGATRILTDERAIPVGDEDVAGSDFDFRVARRVGRLAIDTAFCDLQRESDGRAWVRVWDADRAAGVGLWMDASHRYYMLFTGDTLPEAERRRRGLAVEPMTCAPNAFASGDGLIVLAPGESVTSAWGISALGERA